MEIFDNVNLRSRSDTSFDNWLQTILSKVVTFSDANFVLRLNVERRPHAILYHLENSQNKTMAVISKRGDNVRIETFKRAKPDPERFIKPGFVPATAFVFKKDNEGLHAAAHALIDVLGSQTAYSLGTVTKVKVHQTKSWIVHLESKQTIRMDKTTTTGSYPKVLMYLVMDGENIEVVNATEFDFYFDLVPVLEHA